MRKYNHVLGSLDDGWEFESIEVHVQTDGSSCGIWDAVSDRAFVAYVDSDDYGTAIFPTFFVRWLKAQPLPVLDLFAVRDSAAGRSAAVAGNEAFIREERTRLRELLRDGAREGLLPGEQGARLGDFVEKAADAASEEELNALDERGEEEEAGL